MAWLGFEHNFGLGFHKHFYLLLLLLLFGHLGAVETSHVDKLCQDFYNRFYLRYSVYIFFYLQREIDRLKDVLYISPDIFVCEK